jgi:Rrf2 family nitric oxide-sensitive transcriptional repressor
MFLAANDGQYSIAEISHGYGISKNHLMKVAQRLVAEGYVTSVRGRGGGLMLARPAGAINVGVVVRAVEDTSSFVECLDAARNNCVVTPVCGLRDVLRDGIEAFMQHLDQFTIADLVGNTSAFKAALKLPG